LDARELCLRLAKAESENTVIEILKQAGYWDEPGAWTDFGGIEDNWSTIGNLSDDSDKALVEKIINSIDAMLMRRCLEEGLDPQGPSAPQSIRNAVERFFDLPGGAIESVMRPRRAQLAEDIMLVATGSKKSPCFHIIDRGEGQSPARFPKTLLSLHRGNKAKVAFVQGRYNMGGSGVIPFCGGEHKLHLIVSRRCPALACKETSDPTRNMWGFTVVRKFPSIPPMKNPVVRYLAPADTVLSFDGDPVPLVPGEHPDAYGQPLEWGTFIKLYDYELRGRLSSNIRLNLFFRLSTLLPRLALPVKMIERRGFESERHETVLSGLEVRLAEDPYRRLEPDGRQSGFLSVEGQPVRYSIYVFAKTPPKEGSKKRGRKPLEAYSDKEVVLFVFDGQTQGSIERSRLKDKFELGYIVDSLLVLLDCSDISGPISSEMTMASRDRLRRSKFVRQLETMIIKELEHNPFLRELNNRRRDQERHESQPSKRFAELMEKLIKHSPGFNFLLNPGQKIHHAYSLIPVATQEQYKGEEWPTFFRLVTSKERAAHLGSRFEMKYETDAANDYFERARYPGFFTLYLNGAETKNYSLRLVNGLATLSVVLPADAHVEDVLKYRSVVRDEFNTTDEHLPPEEFMVTVNPSIETHGGPQGKPPRPRGDRPGIERQGPTTADVPEPIERSRVHWDEMGWDEFSALRPVRNGPSYDFYVNMDNTFLEHEIKARKNSNAVELQERYKYAMVLMAMALLGKDERTAVPSGDSGTWPPATELVERITQAVAPVLVTMLEDL